MYQNGWWEPEVDAEMGPVLSWSHPGRDVGKGRSAAKGQQNRSPVTQAWTQGFRSTAATKAFCSYNNQLYTLCNLICCSHAFLGSGEVKNGCRRQSWGESVCHKMPHTIINIQQQTAPPWVCMGKVLNAKPEASVIDQEKFSKYLGSREKSKFSPWMRYYTACFSLINRNDREENWRD